MTVPTEATHLSEEDLILRYYGEAGAGAEAHLSSCAHCRAALAELAGALDAVTDATAAGGAPRGMTDDEVESTWRRLRPALERPARTHGRRWFMLAPLAAAAALVLAFLAGRQWPPPSPAPPGGDARVRERVLLMAVGDHLERSQLLLVELASAPAGETADIAAEQQRAEELVGANRLYRQAAATAGEPVVAGVLEELERLLVEVAHSPDRISPEQLERIQRRIEARGLLFKVRVLETRVRRQQREQAPAAGAIS